MGFPLLSHTRMGPHIGGPSEQAELRDKLSGQASLRVGRLLQALEQCGRSNKRAGEEQGLGEKPDPARCSPAFSMVLTHQDPGTGYQTSSTLFAWEVKGRDEKGKKYPVNSLLFLLSYFLSPRRLVIGEKSTIRIISSTESEESDFRLRRLSEAETTEPTNHKGRNRTL